VTARINRGMALAAGLGTRMGALRQRLPKPLVEVAGRSLLDRVLDRFAEAGVTEAVVNTHYKGEMIAEHLGVRRDPRIEISHEADLLETGGGVANALMSLGPGPFFVANSDALWTDGPVPALARLAAAWDEARMDALLLLHPAAAVPGYDRQGDYFLEPSGRARRRRADETAPLLFAGVQVLHPRLFAGEPVAKYSLVRLYDKAEAAGRLYGLEHDGAWYHVGTPESIAETEARLAVPSGS